LTDTERIAEIDAELTIVNNAITHLLQGGQQYMIQTGASMRQFMAADLDKLRSYRNELRAEKRELNDEAGLTLGAGW
jgi:hypothetical protein